MVSSWKESKAKVANVCSLAWQLARCVHTIWAEHVTSVYVVSTPSGFSVDFCLDFVHAQREAGSKAQVASSFVDNKSPRQQLPMYVWSVGHSLVILYHSMLKLGFSHESSWPKYVHEVRSFGRGLSCGVMLVVG